MIDLEAIKRRLDEPGFDTMVEDMTVLIAEVERLQEQSDRRMEALLNLLTQSVDFTRRLSEIPAVGA